MSQRTTASAISPDRLVAERARVRVAQTLTHSRTFCTMVQKDRRPLATGVCVSHSGQLPGQHPEPWIGVEHDEDRVVTLYHPDELTVVGTPTEQKGARTP
jgi:hypothetical protein